MPARRTLARAAAAAAAAATIAAGASALLAQAPESPDVARAAWRYRRAVIPPAAARDGRFVAIAIPPEVAEHSQPGLQDLRLIADDGREVPFVIDADLPRVRERRRPARLVEAQQERRRTSAWVVDFGEPTLFDRLELEVDGADFSKRVELETSADGERWSGSAGSAWVFDRLWRGRRVHDTVLEQARPIQARFVRLIVDDWRSTPIVVRGVTAILSAELGGRRWTREAGLVRLETPAGQPSRYRIEAAPGVPVERVTLATDDATFWREARVYEVGRGGELSPASAATPIYRLRLEDAELDAEYRDVDLSRAVAGPLVIELDDRDSPPLARPRVTLSGVERRALVPPVASALTLYYGNAATRRPVYDLEAMRARLGLASAYPAGTLGPETVNPRYAALPPMSFLAARGAVADTTQWSVVRTVRIAGGDDVYTLTLAPHDLAYLRSDLGDVRLVDAEQRQVPYVLETAAVAARMPLTIAPAAPRGNAARTSAWQFTVPAGGPEITSGTAPPLAQVDVLFKDTFFTRPAALLLPDPRAPHGQRVLVEEVLRATRPDASTAAAVQSIELGELRASTLTLEVRDGDNAPLTLARAEAIVWVPRLTFKAGKGTYRLLFGNAAASPPTYDLAELRQDVLAYSAIPLDGASLQPVAANPGYARGAAEVARNLTRGPALWAVLFVSVVALIWLTRTILTRPPGPPPPPTA